MATSLELVECRFCLGKVQYKHCTGIFTPLSIRNRLPEILSSIFDLPVAHSSQYSPYICQTCRNRANSVHAKLQALRLMGQKNYQAKIEPSFTSNVAKQGQKRPKDTSGGPSISPDTLKSQPHAKKLRPGLGKRLDFRGELWLRQKKI